MVRLRASETSKQKATMAGFLKVLRQSEMKLEVKAVRF